MCTDCTSYSPPQETPPGPPSAPLDCSAIVISSFSPTCFTVSGNNLCNYLAGIDAALCALQNPTLACSSINMTGLTDCCGNPQTMNLCQWSTYVDQDLCTLLSFMERTEGIFHSCATTPTGPGPIGVIRRNFVVDGNAGTFTGSNTLTGLTSSNSTLSADSSIAHGSSANSLRVTSSSTANTSFSTTTTIQVYKNSIYSFRLYMYAVSGSDSPESVVSLATSGTGTKYPTRNQTILSTAEGKWSTVSMIYVPDSNQTVTITVNITNMVSGSYLNFADLVAEPLTFTIGGANYEYEIPQVAMIKSLYNGIASDFVITNNISTSGSSLTATFGADTYLMNGTAIYTQQQSLSLNPSNDNYIYWDSWTSSYTIKSVSISGPQPNTDATAILLYKLTTNSSGVSSTTNLYKSQPFSGLSIQPATITGSQIAANTVADSNLTASGVTAGTYIGSFQVNTQGRVVAATNLFTFSGQLNNAFIQYSTGTGQWVNTQAPIIDAGTISLPSGTVNSPALTFTGYYSSGGSPAPASIAFNYVVSNTTPYTYFQGVMNNGVSPVQVFQIDSNRNFFINNTLAAPGSPVATGYYQYAHNITINAVTKSAPTFMDGFGNVVQLTKTNTYTQNYTTYSTTVNSYTSDPVSSAFTGIASGVGGTPYAQVTDLNTLRVAYENLRVSYENLLAVVGQMIQDNKTLGIFG